MCEYAATRTMKDGDYVKVHYGIRPPFNCPTCYVLPKAEAMDRKCYKCTGEDDTEFRFLRGWASKGHPTSFPDTRDTFLSPDEIDDSDWEDEGTDDEDIAAAEAAVEEAEAAAEEAEAAIDEAYSEGWNTGFEAASRARNNPGWQRGLRDGWQAFDRTPVADRNRSDLAPAWVNFDALPFQEFENPRQYRLGYEFGWDVGEMAATSLAAFREGYQMGHDDAGLS